MVKKSVREAYCCAEHHNDRGSLGFHQSKGSGEEGEGQGGVRIDDISSARGLFVIYQTNVNPVFCLKKNRLRILYNYCP